MKAYWIFSSIPGPVISCWGRDQIPSQETDIFGLLPMLYVPAHSMGANGMELKNKVIIITGASSGIGAAAADLFAAEGAKLVLAARRADILEKLTEQIRRQEGEALFLAGDVREEAYAETLVKMAVEAYGGLDGAFNNAGILGETGPVPRMTAENWQDVLATNLTSAFFAAKYQIPAMQQRGGGSMVFTSSFVGYNNGGMPGMAAYAASKAGLIGLTLSLATEHAAEGVRVNGLLPGGTRTPMSGNDAETHDFIANLHPLGRMADPLEIAQAALFLLSDRSGFVTGSAMTADGGVSVRLV